MNDSYARHECGIKPFKPTWRSRLIDAIIFLAGLGLFALKAYLIFKGVTS